VPLELIVSTTSWRSLAPRRSLEPVDITLSELALESFTPPTPPQRKHCALFPISELGAENSDWRGASTPRLLVPRLRADHGAVAMLSLDQGIIVSRNEQSQCRQGVHFEIAYVPAVYLVLEYP